ncbi:BON domain-containing protein [Salmonella enterica]|nr:BON domain-containing protein [Salmonella enterica]EBD7602133.1 BON domain-containing protein [Salmonella enterica]EKY9498782.1 BON domain-containing protein [Salmonella enterica]
MDDSTLTLRVSHAISGAGLPPQARVTTTVYQGNVLLTGEIPDDAPRQSASAASGISGTKPVPGSPSAPDKK